MGNPISWLRDNFENVAGASAWGAAYTVGSATLGETGGQVVFTLPSSVAGSHEAAYKTGGSYDLTGDGCFIVIGTMVATGVAAYAFFTLLFDANNSVRWFQQSNSIKAQKVIAGVVTDLYTATWSSTTYKYLRISESGGTITFWSSTNGTSWTSRATLANPFAVTALIVLFGAGCGNVASPGTFKLDDYNPILPALTTNWHYTQVEWPLLYRFRTITLASTSGQGYIATSNDGTTWAYYSGPIGSLLGGYNALSLQSTQAAAQAMAVNLPLDDRWDLPAIVECRFIRLYHRSISGSSYTVREYYPRRLVQSDDIEAESIQAINISASAITADKISVVNLQAVSAQMGNLHMDGVIDIASGGGIYQGSGSFAAPTTGLKLFNSSGVGKLSGYNTGTEQITLDTDGKLKAGAGAVVIDALGITSTAPTSAGATTAYKFISGGAYLGGLYGWDQGSSTIAIEVRAQDTASRDSQVNIEARYATGRVATAVLKASDSGGTGQAVIVTKSASQQTIELTGSSTTTTIAGGLNVGTATGATAGQISTSGSAGIGAAVSSVIRAYVKGDTTTNAHYAIYADDSALSNLFYIRNDGAGFLKAASWTFGSDERLKENVVPSDRGLAHLKRIEAKKFDYKDGPMNQIGFLAADVQAVMPELVVPIDANDTSPTPLLGILSGNLIPVLVRAVQELDARLAELEQKR